MSAFGTRCIFFFLALLLAPGFASADTTAPDCAALRPSTEEIRPFQPLPVEGVDGHTAALLVRLSGPQTPELVLPVDMASPSASVLIPIYPGGHGTGGNAMLNFGWLAEDGLQWCSRSHALHILGLPDAAAGSGLGLESELELLRSLIDDSLADHGTSGAELATRDPAQLDGAPLLLWGPARLAFGSDGIEALWSDLDGEARGLADALVAGTQSLRPDDPLPLADLPPPPPPVTAPPSGPPGWPGGPAAETTPAPEAPAAPPASPEQCQPISIQDLGHRMGRQVSGHAMQSGSAGFALEAGKGIFGLPVISRVGLPTVLLAWATDFASQYQQQTQPSRFETLWLAHAPETLTEDDEAGGRVSEVGLRFSSEGFDMGPLLAELALISGGELAGRGISAGLKRHGLGRAAAGGTQYASGADIVNMMHRGLDQARHLPAYARHAELIGELAGWAGALVAGGVIDQTGWARERRVVPGQCWDASEPLDAGDKPAQRLHFTRAIRRGDDPAHYQAASTGSGRIDVRWDVPVGSGLFGIGLSDQARGASHTFGGSASVEVTPLQLTLTPQRASVEAGQTVRMEVHAAPAADGRVRLSDSHGQLNTELDASTPAVFEIRVPQNLQPGQALRVQAESLSQSGLRRPGQPGFRGPITGRSVLRIEQPRLYLAPARFCLQPGERQQYSAVDDPFSGQPVPVRWQVSRGRIDERGRFQAPDNTGPVRLQAMALNRPDLSATWTLEIDDCRAHWQAELSGATVQVGQISGRDGGFHVSRSPHAGYHQGMAFPGTEEPGGPFLQIELAPTVSPDAVPGGDATPEELLAFLRAAESGRSDALTGVQITIPGAIPGRTGFFRESFLILTLPSGAHESLADSAAGEVIPGFVSNGLLRTADVFLEENTPSRVRGRFSARTLPQRFPRGSSRYPASERSSGIFYYPEQEITVSGSFDIRLDR